MIEPGQKFSRLTAIAQVVWGRHPKWRWLCDCGNETEAAPYHVKSGHTQSCGCIWREKCRKHGHGHDANGRQTRTYRAWVNLRSRASGRYEQYKRSYTDRGIKVCDRWLAGFENFLADMGECPPGLTLDRYPDNDGNYEPSNCRWATSFQQMANTRRAHEVTVDGVAVCLAEACRRLGLNYATIGARISSGRMMPQEAIETPVGRRGGAHFTVTS